MKSLQVLFDNKIKTHLYNYYWKELGLFNWQELIQIRKNEVPRAKFLLKIIEKLAGIQLKNSRMLDIGCGWGGFVVAGNELGAKSMGCDVDKEVIEIAKLRSKIYHLKKKFCLSKSEKLPFPDETFDYVQCITVFEHVQDVKKSISEFVRVLKKGGTGFVQAPNYNQPIENHYKVLFPPKCPKTLAKIYLLMLARPYKYIDSINYIDYESVKSEFEKNRAVVTDIGEQFKLLKSNQLSTDKSKKMNKSPQKQDWSYNATVARIMSKLKHPCIRFVENQLNIHDINFLIHK